MILPGKEKARDSRYFQNQPSLIDHGSSNVLDSECNDIRRTSWWHDSINKTDKGHKKRGEVKALEARRETHEIIFEIERVVAAVTGICVA
jgi:hypothetical protein